MSFESGIRDIHERLNLGIYQPGDADTILTDYLRENKGIPTAEMLSAKATIDALRAAIRNALAPSVVSEISSVQLESFRTKSLKNLLHDWYTMDIEKEGEGREALVKAMNEKLEGMRIIFIDHFSAMGKSQVDAEKAWMTFKDLYMTTFALIDYGVMRGDTQNVTQFTAKHDEILSAARKPGAMTMNGKFNKNELVRSNSTDEGEQIGPNPGLIQKIVFAIFQEMRKPDSASADSRYLGGMDRKSFFSRNKGFGSDMDLKMVNAVCGWNEMVLWDGRRVFLGIADELREYPQEVIEVIKDIARWKASRDDIGSKAGVWHLGFNKGAFKYSDGSMGRPSGVLASILYQVGKNSARENHAAMLNFVDLTDNEMMGIGKPALATDVHNYKKWTDIRNAEVVRFSQELFAFQTWVHPNWSSIKFDKFKPTKWYQDFPALDEFFNQEEGSAVADDYIKARDAVLKIIELAAGSHQTILSTNTEQMREKIIVLVKTFNSEIGKALAYIGPQKNGSKYSYVHELILACYQFYLASIVIAIPGNISMVSKIGTIRNFANREYEELYDLGVRTIVETINLNSTLFGYYWVNTTGKISDSDTGVDGFVQQKSLRREWRQEARLTQRFQQWRIDNAPELVGVGALRQADVMNTQPKQIVNTKDGWKSSYEDPQSQRT